MNDVLELVRKNFKNLLRSKASSLIVILGPLLVILLAGLAFDNSAAYSVKIGVFRPDTNDLTDRFINSLHGQFKVYEYDSESKCVDAIKGTDINTCMVFAKDFKIGVPASNQITFYVDYSRINLVYAVMRSMTEKIGEESLEASENLTRVLLKTLEFTQERISDQREILVRLTTENELLTKNSLDLMAELGDMDLAFDSDAFSVDEVIHQKTQVKQWMETSIALGDRGLSKATSFIDAADALVKNSGASTETKNALLIEFQKTVDEAKQLKADFASTKNLTQNAFAEFDVRMNKLADQIVATKGKLGEADTSRQLGIRVLESIRNLLDQSLISVLGVQQALNDIDRRIRAIEVTDAGAIAQPIVTSIKPIVQEKTYLNYLFPVLIVLVVMFTSLLITPTLILLDRNSPASVRTYMTPVRDWSYVLANFLTSFCLLVVQIVVILAIVSIFFAGDLVSNVPKALLLLLLSTSLFILIGMIVGYAFKSEETATLGAVSVGALFLFVSDVIIPLESMPEVFAYIAGFNPYVLASSLLRRSLLFDSPLVDLLPDILVLLGYLIAAACIAVGCYMLTRNYSLELLMKRLSPYIDRVRRKGKAI